MSNTLEPGKYLANVEEFGIIKSAQKGTPGLNVKFKLKDSGQNAYWTQWLTANTMERIVENLVETGLLKTKKFSDLAEGVNGGGMCLDTEVEIVIVHEPYEKDGEQKVAVKVEFVNKPGSRGMQNTLAKADAVTALAGLNLDAEILAAQQKTGVKVEEKTAPADQNFTADDIPF